ncbi:MAG: Ig-like domain-containing protein, partial [Ruminococcus sp.]|nr:Ig-like domain-containing protein [Ruminococcus sp.]
GTFTTPAASTKPTIKSAKYDREDKELEVDFSTKVQYKNLKVTVKDSKGKSYTVKITEKENDSLELRVTLTKGTKYTVTVSGVSLYNKGNYVSVSKTFTA